MNEQPDWLKKTVAPLSDARSYQVALAGKVYAIIKSPGATVYLNRFSGNQYSRTEFILVRQGLGYCHNKPPHGIWKTVWTGRLTKEGQAVIAKALADAEAMNKETT